MPIIPTESEVLHMKKTHGLDEREMELVKLKKLFAETIEQMLEAEWPNISVTGRTPETVGMVTVKRR